MSDRSGQTIRDYDLIRKVGEGEFASVYEARDINIDRVAAVKIIHPRHMAQQDSMLRFKSEASIIAHLNHPHIVRLHSFWMDDDGAYIAMQWMASGNLESLIEQHTQLSLETVHNLLQKIAPALNAVHRQRIIHRDLKPANIMFDSETNPYVADFGLAKWQTKLTGVSLRDTSIGTPAYMPPEQVESGDTEITGAADIYSLGLMIYEMLTGKHPFHEATGIVELILHQLRDPVPPIQTLLPHIPNAVDAIIQKATQKNPEDRFGDVLELADAFQDAIGIAPNPALTTAHLASIAGVVEPRGDVYAHVYTKSGAILEKPRRLIGRETTVMAILDELEHAERVLLHGLAGMGKTSTAATVAAQYIDDLGDKVIWIELGKQTPDTFFDAIANALGEQSAMAGKTGDQRILAVRELLLEQADTLLVIDNIWNEQAMIPIMRSIPYEIPVLMTSRKLLSIDGILIEIDSLTDDDALDLLQLHANRSFGNSTVAYRLLNMLGNHPYAIELAGSRLKIYRHITLEKLIQDIQKTPHDTGQLGQIKKRDITDLLDESLRELSEPLRDLLITMGGLYTTYASLALLGEVVEHDEATLTQNLAEIERNGLIRLNIENTQVPFYRLHDLTYSYLFQHFIKQKSRKEIISSTRRYMHRHVDDYDTLELDLMNILGAARTAHRNDDSESLIDIMRQLVVEADYLMNRGTSQLILELTQECITIAEDNDDSKSAHYFLVKMGNVYNFISAQYNLAFEAFLRSLKYARQMGDQKREAIMLGLIGIASFEAGMSDAEMYLGKALKTALLTDDLAIIGRIYIQLSVFHFKKSNPDYVKSKQYCEKVVEIAHRHDDIIRPNSLLIALRNRAACETKQGLYKDALETDSQALNLARQINNQLWIAELLFSVAHDYHWLGNEDETLNYLQQALVLALHSNLEELVGEIEDFAVEHNLTLTLVPKGKNRNVS